MASEDWATASAVMDPLRTDSREYAFFQALRLLRLRLCALALALLLVLCLLFAAAVAPLSASLSF